MLGVTMATKKRKPRKQTSDRVSRIAAKVMRIVASKVYSPDSILAVYLRDHIMMRDIAALAASCLAQDEVKGKR